MAIANRNPEGDVEKQILAAAEYVPAPLMPLQADTYIEVLSFIKMIGASVVDENVKAEAKRLVSKMLLFKPVPDRTKILAVATPEEKRKRNRRLAIKNGQPLGSTVSNPPTSKTSEHLQRLELKPPTGAGIMPAVCSSGSEPGPESAATGPAREETSVGTPPNPVVTTTLNCGRWIR